jgi:uncharacterized RDD family membrane protein YckC
MSEENIPYAGWWVRAIAIIMDTTLIISPITLLIGLTYGMEALRDPSLHPEAGLIQVLLYGAIVSISWVRTGQTPGQKAFKIIIVDKTTQKTINYPQAILRFIGYFISMLTIVGFFLPVFRKDKRALHDIIAHTTVRYVYTSKKSK